MNMCNKEDLQKLPYKFQVMFAIFCARQVIHLILEKDREVCIKAIEAAEGFIEERTSKEECAYTATAANAAYTAAAAANAAAKQKIIQEQWDYYNELLNFEANFEEILLGE